MVVQHQEYADLFDNCEHLKEKLTKIRNSREKVTGARAQSWNERVNDLLENVSFLMREFNRLASVERNLLAKAFWYLDLLSANSSKTPLERDQQVKAALEGFETIFSELSSGSSKVLTEFRRILETANSLEIWIRVVR